MTTTAEPAVARLDATPVRQGRAGTPAGQMAAEIGPARALRRPAALAAP